jgi:hypothetical protein
MPRRQRTDFTRRQALDADGEAWLRNEPCGWFKFKGEEFLKQLWQDHGESIVEEHVTQWPGTRPARWWQYDAPRSPRGTYPGCFYDGKLPEPRERLGGVGTPNYEALCYVPSFSFGIPDGWIDQSDVAYYGKSGTFKGVAIDPDDPPLFESEATYLKRHGLLLPGEAKRLTKANWEPEAIA